MAKITKERKSLAVGLLIFVAVVIAAAVMGLIMLSPVTEYVEGQAEADEYRVSSKVPGRVVRFYVREGDTVRRGDTLVVLDAPDVLAKLEQARAAKDAAQAKQDEAMAGTRHEQVQAAYDMWQKAKAGLDIAVKSHRRVKELFEQGVLPEQKFDEAAAQLAAAQATEKAAHSQYQMAVNGARREDKAAAAAMVSRAAQADGEVSEIFPKAGELVGTGAPIINVAMMDKMWVTFNIREDMLGHIGMNRKFKARIPALGGREVELVTYYMKDLGSYAAWKATKTTGDYDLKTFEVRARPVKPVEGLRPGMSVIFPQQH